MTLARRAYRRRAGARLPHLLHRRALLRDQHPGDLRPVALGARSWQKGAQYGITPYGTEAMHLLRAEKGFIIVGQETDGTVTPDDLGLGGMVKKTGDFIGRRSLFRSDTMRDDRKQLVGLLTDDPNVVLMEGAHVIGTRGGERAAGADARPRHLELFQPEPRPLDRHGDGEGRAEAHGRAALGVAPRRRADPGHRHRHRFSGAAGEGRMAELRRPSAARRSPIARRSQARRARSAWRSVPFLGKFILRADPQAAVEPAARRRSAWACRSIR